MQGQYFEKGEHTIVLNADMNPGFYLLVLEMNGKALVQKLVVE